MHFINPRYVNVVFSFYMAAIMAFIMSSVLVAINAGIDGAYFGRVLKSYMVAMPVAFCSVLSVRPLVVWLTQKTIKRHPEK